jgi:hypothetical protein
MNMNGLNKAGVPEQIPTGIIITGGMQKVNWHPGISLFDINHDAWRYDSLTNAFLPALFFRKNSGFELGKPN